MIAPITDTPIPGFYRMRLRSGGQPVGVRVWFGPPADPVTGEELDRSWRWQATVFDRDEDDMIFYENQEDRLIDGEPSGPLGPPLYANALDGSVRGVELTLGVASPASSRLLTDEVAVADSETAAVDEKADVAETAIAVADAWASDAD